MKKKVLSIVIFFSLSSICMGEEADTPSSSDPRALSIMKEHYQRKSAPKSMMKISLLLIDKNGAKLTRQFSLKSISDNNLEASYAEVLKPADIAGVRFLSRTSAKGNEQRLYLPALHKSRKISGAGSSSGGKGGRFLGSDICYYDLEDKDLDDALYSYAGTEEKDGRVYHLIDAWPLVSDCPYGKSRFYVCSEDFFIYRTEMFHPKSKRMIKRVEVRSLTTVGGIDFVREMVIENLEFKHTTLYSLDSVDIESSLPASVFSLQHLER